MTSRRKRRGVRPRPEDLHFDAHQHADARTLRMCRVVQRRLAEALGQLDDARLHALQVADVVPESGAALMVVVVAPPASRVHDVLSHLDAARGLLRSELASALQRKRTPHLRFVVIPRVRVHDAGEEDAP